MSSVSVHAQVRPNDSECYHGTQNLSSPNNCHNWWVQSEFQDGGVNIDVERFCCLGGFAANLEDTL